MPGLERLAGEYRKVAEPLATAPETPLSPPAEAVIGEAGQLRERLVKRAEELERDARQRRDDDERVRDLIEEVARLIEDREFGAALPIVDQGLGLAPGHPVLTFFREVIRDELD
ncbi:MAG: hypothetical protein GY856_19905 [bacterium]|nr:hypothetical protein [bacterium]